MDVATLEGRVYNNRMRSHGPFLGEKGMTIVELLLAAALGSIAIFGGAKSYDIISRSVQYSRFISRAIVIETQLLSSLSDPGFMAAYRSELALSGTATDLTITHEGETIAKAGAAVQLDSGGKPCASSTACDLRIRLELICQGAASARRCFAAYQISSLNAHVPMVPFGSSSEGPFTAADFRIPIAFDHYLRADLTQCPAGQFAIGIHRSNGSLICIPSSAGGCGAKEIFQGYTVSPAGVSPICLGDPSSSCPFPYVIRSAVFNGGGASCVFVTVDSGAMMNPWVPAPSVTVQACPDAYYNTIPTGACVAGNIVSTPGYCGQTCTTVAGVTTCVDDYAYAPTPMTVSSVSGGTMSCTVIPSTGACGSHATGSAYWDAQCVLKVPSSL